MPRPGQARYSRTIGLTLPPDIDEAFRAEAGPGYGAKVNLFRRMWSLYLEQKNSDSLYRQLADEKRKREEAEHVLRTIRNVLLSKRLI